MTKFVVLLLIFLPQLLAADPVVVTGSLTEAQVWVIIGIAAVVFVGMTLVSIIGTPRLLNSKFKEIDSRFDEVDARFDKVDAEIGGLKTEIGGIKVEIGEVKKDLRKVQLDTMRLQILAENVPDEDKLSIYDMYRSMGGNSYVEAYIANVKKRIQEKTAKKREYSE
jgi:hypothetical protein